MATNQKRSATKTRNTQKNQSNTTPTPQAETPATETLEQPKEETPNETPTETPVNASRRVFHHKACTDEKASTMTKMKPDETLRLTDGTLTKDGTTYPVLSLKRGKRIYYLYEVTAEELALAQENHKKELEKKEEERKAKEALKNKEKETSNATPTPPAASEEKK